MSTRNLTIDIFYEIGEHCFGIHPDYIMEELGFYRFVIDVPNALVEMVTVYGLIYSQLPYIRESFPGSIDYDLKKEGILEWNRRKVVRFFEEHKEKIFDKIFNLRSDIF